MTDEVLSSVGLSETIANCRHYLALHPIEDPHLAILIGALLAALQTYANAATDETIRAVLHEVVESDEDEPLPDARLNS